MASLGTLSVYLTAQTSQFNQALRNSQMAIGRFSTMAKAGMIAGAAAVSAFAVKSIQAYSESEDAINNFEAALRANGDEVEKTSKRIQKFASDIQSQTIFGDEQILDTLSYARNLGIIPDKLEEAGKAAAGLAAKYKLDLSSAMQLIGRASQGQTGTLTRYGIVLDDTLSKEEKFNALLKIGVSNFSLAQAQTNTFSGALTQAKNLFGDATEEVGKFVVKGLDLQNNLKKLSTSINSVIGYLQNMDSVTATAAVRIGTLAIGVISLATAFKILNVQAIAKGIIVIATYNGIMGIKLALILKTTLAEYASIVAMSAATGASKLRVASLIAETLAVRGLVIALKGFGVGVAAIGVAWGGWEIGKKISELTGLDKVLEDFYAKWIFGIDEVQEKMKEQDKKLVELNKQIAERKKAGFMKPPTVANFPQQITDPELLKAQKEMEDAVYQKKFKQLSIDGQINTLIEKRAELAVKYRDATSQMQSFEIGKEIAGLSSEIAELQKQQQDKIAGAKESFQKKIEAFNYKNMTDEEKINFLLQKRAKLQDNVLLSSQDKAYELKGEILDIDEQLQEMQNSKGKLSGFKESQFAGAVERGTVDAYRAELAGKNTTEEYTKKTADNTSKMYNEQKKATQYMQKFAAIGVA